MIDEVIVAYMIFAIIIFWSLLYFEWSKFKKDHKEYFKTMIELRKIKTRKK